MSRSINIVGAGVSGSLIAYFLRNTFKISPQIPIKIFDKSRGVGGRLSTSRLNDSNNKTIAKVDLGAQQYSFNSYEELSEQQRLILSLWKEHDLLEKIEKERIVNAPDHYRSEINYEAKSGNSSLVKILLEKCENLEKVLNKRIQKDDVLKESDAEWVFTIPAAQFGEIFNDNGSDFGDSTFQTLLNTLEKVQYSVRYCLGLAVSKVPISLQNNAVYQNTSKSIRYLSNKKIDQSLENESICIHSSVPFALKIKDTKTKEEGGEILLKELKQDYPDLEITSIKHHRWLYSQVYKSSVAGQYFMNSGNITVSGDCFAKTANVLGCIDAAYKTAEHLATIVGESR